MTNEEFLEFVEPAAIRSRRGGAKRDWNWLAEHGIQHPTFWERDGERWYCRGMFERLPLPRAWPVYVSQAEASAFARWRGRAAADRSRISARGVRRRADGPRAISVGRCARRRRSHGVFDFNSWEPQPVGTHPRGAVAPGASRI